MKALPGAENILKMKEQLIKGLTKDIGLMQNIKPDTLYRIDIQYLYRYQDLNHKEYRIVYVRGYNKDSIRCEILTGSENPSGHGWVQTEDGKWIRDSNKINWESIKFDNITKVTPVEKKDLPLYIGDKYVSKTYTNTLKEI